MTKQQLKTYKKMVDFLYKCGDNCSFEQKELRLMMFNNWVQGILELETQKDYQLNLREQSQLSNILNK